MIIELVPNAEHISLSEISKLYDYPNSVILDAFIPNMENIKR